METMMRYQPRPGGGGGGSMMGMPSPGGSSLLLPPSSSPSPPPVHSFPSSSPPSSSPLSPPAPLGGNVYGVASNLRPPPQVIENMLDELEDKVRHYFMLYTREKKAREKTERYSYWLQKEIAEQKEALLSSAEYIDSLQKKFDELRGDPDMVRDTIQRIDLMYAQVDTLVQALAGICSFAAVRDATRDQLVQCVLDYLYPCRALDPRLYELYGILYYRRLGQTKLEPEGPPPPPPPAYVPLAEGIGGPWIRPSPYTIFRTPGIDDSTIERGMKETKKAIEEAEAKAKGEAAAKKAGDGETAKGPKAVSKVGGGVGGLKPSALKGTASASDSAAAKPAAKKEAPSAPTAEGPPKREPTDPKVELKGMFLFVRKLQDFKRPPSSKVESLRIVVRLDSEPTTEMKKKEGRFFLVEKCGGSPGKEEATFNMLVEFKTLPPKKPNTTPKFIIDVYDNKGFAALGRAEKSFTDKDVLDDDAPWQIKDTSGKPLGTLICTVTPIPGNAPLPPAAGGTADAKEEAKKADAPKKEPGDAKKGPADAKKSPEFPKPAAGAAGVKKSGELGGKSEAPGIKKPDLPKPAADIKKPELPKPPGGGDMKKPELPKTGITIKKPDLPKPGGMAEIKKPDLPKPGGMAEIKKPELPKPGGMAEIKKPELPKPGGGMAEIKKPELPKPGGGGIMTKPDFAKGPGVGIKKPDLPKPGGIEIKKPPLGAKPGESSPGIKKPDLPKPGGSPPGMKKPDLPTPGGAVKKPDLPKPPGPTTPVGLKKPDLAKSVSGVGMIKKPDLSKPAIEIKKPGLATKPGGGPSPAPLTPKKPGEIVKPGVVGVKKPALTPVKPGAPTPLKPGASLKPATPGVGPKPTPVKPPGPKPGAPDSKTAGGPPKPVTPAKPAAVGKPADAKAKPGLAPKKPSAPGPALGKPKAPPKK